MGKKAPELPATALNEAMAKPLSEFAGKPVLVNVMASWCAPCRAELPALALLSNEVPVIAIAYKDRQEDTTQFLSQYGNLSQLSGWIMMAPMELNGAFMACQKPSCWMVKGALCCATQDLSLKM